MHGVICNIGFSVTCEEFYVGALDLMGFIEGSFQWQFAPVIEIESNRENPYPWNLWLVEDDKA